MGNMGLSEWLIVLLIVLVLFGATRIPTLMKGLGQGVREFKKSVSGEDEPETTDKVKEKEKQEKK
jgi:sec-independent protein translocase protein TatA